VLRRPVECALLDEGGLLSLEVSVGDVLITSHMPYQMQTARQVLQQYTNNFWRAGLFLHKLEVKPLQFLDQSLQPNHAKPSL
jgi:hypothetical protein